MQKTCACVVGLETASKTSFLQYVLYRSSGRTQGFTGASHRLYERSMARVTIRDMHRFCERTKFLITNERFFGKNFLKTIVFCEQMVLLNERKKKTYKIVVQTR